MPHLANALWTWKSAYWGKVQLRATERLVTAPCDQVDHLELGVGELSQPVLARGVADDATLHTEPAQLTAYPARIGERFVVQVGVEGIELIQRLVRVVGVGEFTAGVLGGCGV